MTQKTTLTLLATLAANVCVANASEWLQVKESRYDSQENLTYEVISHYNSMNKKTLQRNTTESDLKVWEYDADGNILSEESLYFDNWNLQAWTISNRKEYTYNTIGKIATETTYMSDWFGNFGINGYVEYTYDDNHNLIREESYSDPQKSYAFEIKEYTDYTASGKPGKLTIFYIGDNQESNLTSYDLYHYNEDDNLYLLETYGLNYSTDEIDLRNKTEWTFDAEKRPVQEIMGSYDMMDNSFAYSTRYDYGYDSENSLKNSELKYYWNAQNGEWQKLVRTEYSYSDQMDGTRKTPLGIEATASANNYNIAWQTPLQTEGITGFNLYLGDALLETLPAHQLDYTLTESWSGNIHLYLTAIYGDEEMNTSNILQLEALNYEEKEYAMPSFGDITYVKEENYQVEYEMYWHAPETDMEVVGYNVHYNYWPLTEEPVTGTTFRCKLRKMLNEIAFGVSAVYADGGESEANHKDYRLDQLLTSIIKAGSDKDIWTYAGSICVDGSNIHAIEIFDATGMKVHGQVVNNGINLVKLPSNIYIIKAITDNGTITRKVFNK